MKTLAKALSAAIFTLGAALFLGDHKRIPIALADPTRNVRCRSRFGFEGGAPIHDALVVDLGNRGSVGRDGRADRHGHGDAV